MRGGKRGACKYMAFTGTIRLVRNQKVVVVIRGIGALVVVVVVLAMSWAFMQSGMTMAKRTQKAKRKLVLGKTSTREKRTRQHTWPASVRKHIHVAQALGRNLDLLTGTSIRDRHLLRRRLQKLRQSPRTVLAHGRSAIHQSPEPPGRGRAGPRGRSKHHHARPVAHGFCPSFLAPARPPLPSSSSKTSGGLSSMRCPV